MQNQHRDERIFHYTLRPGMAENDAASFCSCWCSKPELIIVTRMRGVLVPMIQGHVQESAHFSLQSHPPVNSHSRIARELAIIPSDQFCMLLWADHNPAGRPRPLEKPLLNIEIDFIAGSLWGRAARKSVQWEQHSKISVSAQKGRGIIRRKDYRNHPPYVVVLPYGLYRWSWAATITMILWRMNSHLSLPARMNG